MIPTAAVATGMRITFAVLACLLCAQVADAQTARSDFYVTNRNVYASLMAGGKLYIGGDFTRVGPASGGGIPLDATTGQPLAGFPKVAGGVQVAIPDEAVKLGRVTDWSGADKGPVRGMGLRTFLCGDDALSILEWRNLELE